MKRWLFTLLLALYVSISSVARADDVAEAKNLFKAGAAAYTAGDYLAAIQALETAYRLSPLPAIAFSLAQAERRQFFASREPSHLARAIELFRLYLTQVPSGGRRSDAVDALAQLEPLAVAMPRATAESGEPARRESEKTRLMVSTEAPRATVALDASAPVPAPLIAEVTAGEHRVRVDAPGFFASERRVVAIAGALVPVEVELEERPAVVIVEPSTEADLYVDGSYVRRVRKGARIELATGAHELTFARKGRSIETRKLWLERGSTQTVSVELGWTGQRITAVSLLAASGASLLGGLGFVGLAVEREQSAQELLDRRDERPLSEAELEEYDDTVEERDRFRAAAIGSLAISAGCLATGLLLFELDDPSVRDGSPRSQPDRAKPPVRVQASLIPAKRGLGLGARLTF